MAFIWWHYYKICRYQSVNKIEIGIFKILSKSLMGQCIKSWIYISTYWISQPGSLAGFYTWLSVRYFACSNMLDPGMSLKHKFVTLVFTTFFKPSYFQVNNFSYDVSLLCCCQINPIAFERKWLLMIDDKINSLASMMAYSNIHQGQHWLIRLGN